MQRRKGDGAGSDYSKLRRGLERPRRLRRILMIETSRVDRVLVNAALTLKGQGETRLTEVADFDLGLSLLLQRGYDLVLIDDAMVGQSPSETTRAIRGVAPTTPIIRHAQYLEAIEENGNGLDQLVEAVEAALAGATVARTAAMPSFASASWTVVSAAS